ncbi:MAG: DUF938 domain-containing protein [Sulfurimicrobium sp.]
MKPYAESCEQNRDPILAVLQGFFADRKQVLEIASSTSTMVEISPRKAMSASMPGSRRAIRIAGCGISSPSTSLP